MFTLQWEEEDDGGYSFSCQHGPNECYGNIFQVFLKQTCYPI